MLLEKSLWKKDILSQKAKGSGELDGGGMSCRFFAD